VATRAHVLLLASDFHRRCGGFDEARQHAAEALTAMKNAGETEGEAAALAHLGGALEGLGRFQEAREAVRKALAGFRDAGVLAGQAESLKTLGVISARVGELPAALERFNEAREIYRQVGDRKGEADILGNLGALNYYLGDYERCIEYTEQARPLFQEMGNRIGSAKCLTNLGNSYSALGAFDEALDCHQQALEVYEQLEDVNGRADSLCNMGLARAALGVGGQPGLVMDFRDENGELRAAIGAGTQSLQLYESIGSQRGEMIARFGLGTILLCVGQVENAESHLQAALDLSREMDVVPSTRWALSSLARARFLAGDLSTAETLSEEALGLLGAEEAPEAAELRFVHYRVLTALGREESLDHLSAAHRSLMAQADTIVDKGFRERFLGAYRGLLDAWE
jgi:tetratricopeptide (TPR) repeat protein